MTLEYIKKLMGWCPNAKTLETGFRISPANFEVYAQSGGEKGDRSGEEKTRSNFSHMKRIGLLFTSIGSLVAVSSLALNLKGNISSLMVGIGTVLFLIGVYLQFFSKPAK